MGSWITYGLGSENQNLPGFIAMCPGGYPVVATQNWRSAFLPGAYQGTYIDTQHTDIHKLIENIRNDAATPAEQRRQLDLVRRLNERHAAARCHDPALEARIESFELAYRMQGEAAEAFDISREPAAIRRSTGQAQRPGNCSSRADCSSGESASSRSGAAPGSPGTTMKTLSPIIASSLRRGTRPSRLS